MIIGINSIDVYFHINTPGIEASHYFPTTNSRDSQSIIHLPAYFTVTTGLARAER